MQDLTLLSDAELAARLDHVENAIESSYPIPRGLRDEEAHLLNEVCGRLNLPPDETEQGLTKWASVAIDAYVAQHLATS